MVKRAERALSGSMLLRKVVRAAAKHSSSSCAEFVEDGRTGRGILRSLIIWSAVLRRSEERSGARGLICEAWWG